MFQSHISFLEKCTVESALGGRLDLSVCKTIAKKFRIKSSKSTPYAAMSKLSSVKPIAVFGAFHLLTERQQSYQTICITGKGKVLRFF